MDFDIDGGTLLYILGIGFAFGALTYFVRDVVFSLSIPVKAAILFLAFLSFLVGGVTMDRDVLDHISLILSGAAYVVFLVYVVVRYDLAATGIFFVLFGSAVLFVFLGYTLRTKRPTISPRTATIIVTVFLVVTVLLVGADITSAGMSTNVDVNETITVSAPADAPPDEEMVPAEATVGTLTVTNDGPFTRPLSVPELSACLAGQNLVAGGDVYLDYHPRSYDRPDTIAGGASHTAQITARLPIPNGTDEMTYSIEQRAECEVAGHEPTLVIHPPET
ncbi:DUF1109 domain-containing protein [Halodesulfurarchaeum sp.]|uniref:DUF1109 domain-containing protein n=1 Tax=Halodesulfurarchaeum sp. TaxID=1980530 RepID=UPI002FC34728